MTAYSCICWLFHRRERMEHHCGFKIHKLSRPHTHTQTHTHTHTHTHIHTPRLNRNMSVNQIQPRTTCLRQLHPYNPLSQARQYSRDVSISHCPIGSHPPAQQHGLVSGFGRGPNTICCHPSSPRCGIRQPCLRIRAAVGVVIYWV